MTDGDPVSWKVVEKGWDVVGADGEEVGAVHEVVGDADKDIFNGLAVAPGLLRRPVYVPAERVARITEKRVELSVTREDVERLPEFEEPPASLAITPADPSASDRVADVFAEPESRPQPVTPWRRLLQRLFPRR